MNPPAAVSVRAPPRGPGPCSIKHHGTTPATCDGKPIQTPGCIQAHGALLVSRPGDMQSCNPHGANAHHVKPVDPALHLKVLQQIFAYWLGSVVLPA